MATTTNHHNILRGVVIVFPIFMMNIYIFYRPTYLASLVFPKNYIGQSLRRLMRGSIFLFGHPCFYKPFSHTFPATILSSGKR